MRILIIRNSPSYMDVQYNTYNIQEVGLAKALVRKGQCCDILFWTNNKEKDISIPVDNIGEITVYYRHGISILKNAIYFNCKKMFQAYDILQTAEYNQLQSWLLAKNYAQKTVIYHGPYFSEFNKKYNLMCKVFDVFFLNLYKKRKIKFITKSDKAQRFLIDKGIDPQNIESIGVGIDAQMLVSGDALCEEPLYLRMKEDKSTVKILYIGRIEERRNILFLLDVVSDVYKIYKDVKLYVIGTGNQMYLDRVRIHAKNLGIEDIIVWQEKMQQKYLSHIYNMADFFLLPTEYEIFGMVLLEAMYYKTVVLTTDNGGSMTLINNSQNGFVLKDMNSKIWAECLVNIKQDSENMKAIQEKAYNTIRDTFTWDALVDKFIVQYQNLLN